MSAEAFSAQHPFRVSRLVFGSTILDSQGSSHEVLRTRLRSALRRRVIDRLIPTLIAPVVEPVVQGLSGQGAIDVLTDIADVVPMRVLSEVLGCDAAAAPWLAEQAAPVVTSIDLGVASPTQARTARAELSAFAAELLDQPALDGTVVDVLRDEVANRTISREVAVDHIVMLIVAGSATTTAAIANSMITLVEQPGILDAVAADAIDARDVVTEALRLRPPVRFVPRFAIADTELAGIPVKKNDIVQLCISSTNRDAASFDEPDRFEPHRPRPPRPLTFGHGIHGCLGAWLGESEAAVVLRTVASALQGLPLSLSLDWRAGWTFSRPGRLNVQIGTAVSTASGGRS